MNLQGSLVLSMTFYICKFEYIHFCIYTFKRQNDAGRRLDYRAV